MRKVLWSLVLAVMMLLSSLSLPILADVAVQEEVPVAASIASSEVLGPIVNVEEASAGATGCALWGSGYKSNGYVYGTVEWSCYSSWYRSTDITVCLYNLTTGTSLGCVTDYDVATYGRIDRARYASYWHSIQMTAIKCTWGLNGGWCENYYWYI